MTPTTNDKLINTALIFADIDATAYPFISGLRAMGMNAILYGEKIALTPSEKIQPRHLDIATNNRDAIIAEIRSLNLLAAQDMASDVVATSAPLGNPMANASQYEDPAHDLDLLEQTYSALFYHAASLGWSGRQYWPGPHVPQPARPYCYVKSVRLEQPATPTKQAGATYKYWPMIADSDGNDYVWMLPEVCWQHAASVCK